MRSENEMQITLARLRDEFSVNVTPPRSCTARNWPTG